MQGSGLVGMNLSQPVQTSQQEIVNIKLICAKADI